MRGTLIGKNPVRGMFAVEVGGDGITVFELLDSVELELQDTIIGTLDEHGSVRLRCERLDDVFEAYIQGYGLRGLSREALRRHLLIS